MKQTKEHIYPHPNEHLPEKHETAPLPEDVPSVPTRAELRLAREALGDRIWRAVTQKILEETAARAEADGSDRTSQRQ